MLYSIEFKQAVVQKLLNRGIRTGSEISEETGINLTTIYEWRKKFANVSDMKKTSPQNRTVSEKLKALTEYEALALDKRGEYLRSNGLHEENLVEWRTHAEEAFSPVRITTKERKEKIAADKKIKSLEKELARKEKALAEAAALIILKKKADLIWGEGEDE